jgi:hypothetical protein
LSVETNKGKNPQGRITADTYKNDNIEALSVITEKHRTRDRQRADKNINAERLRAITTECST